MKLKLLALILTATVVSWPQTATQNTPSNRQQSTAPDKTKCACCDKMAKSDSKGAHAACMGKHDGKQTASGCSGRDDKSCWGGKDAASCMKDGEIGESCCHGKDGMKCDPKASEDCGKRCCGSNKSEKQA